MRLRVDSHLSLRDANDSIAPAPALKGGAKFRRRAAKTQLKALV